MSVKRDVGMGAVTGRCDQDAPHEPSCGEAIESVAVAGIATAHAARDLTDSEIRRRKRRGTA